MDAYTLEQRQPVIPAVKLVAGLFLAILGIIMTLDNLGTIDGSRIIRYWPALLVVVGLIKLRDRRDRMLAVLAIAAGSLMLASRLGLLHGFLEILFWPLVLIVAGGALVARSLGLGRASATEHPATPDRSTIWTVLSKRGEVSTAQDYTGGRVVAFMGGCELDLTDANIGPEPAVLELMSTWAGIIVRVPPSWDVVEELVPIMGAVDVRKEGPPGGPLLIIRGLAFMGVIEVRTGKRGAP